MIDSDILLVVNTGNFSHHVDPATRIELHSTNTIVQDRHYPSLGFRTLLPLLTKRLSSLRKKVENVKLDPKLSITSPIDLQTNGIVTQNEFWSLWANEFFQPNDVILGEAGTSTFGLLDIKFPEKALWLSQILWASIGNSIFILEGTRHFDDSVSVFDPRMDNRCLSGCCTGRRGTGQTDYIVHRWWKHVELFFFTFGRISPYHLKPYWSRLDTSIYLFQSTLCSRVKHHDPSGS